MAQKSSRMLEIAQMSPGGAERDHFGSDNKCAFPCSTTGTMANGLTPHEIVLAMTLFIGLPLASYFVLGRIRETTLRGDTAYTPVMELHARGSSAASAGRYDGSAPPGL